MIGGMGGGRGGCGRGGSTGSCGGGIAAVTVGLVLRSS